MPNFRINPEIQILFGYVNKPIQCGLKFKFPFGLFKKFPAFFFHDQLAPLLNRREQKSIQQESHQILLSLLVKWWNQWKQNIFYSITCQEVNASFISFMIQCLSLSQAAVPCFLSFTYLHYDPMLIFISGCCTMFFIFYLSPLCSNVCLYLRLLYHVFYLLLISTMFQCVPLSQAAVPCFFYLLLISAMFQCVYLSQAAVSVPP